MCGIVGMFRPEGLSGPEALEARLNAAAATISYRGPDASGCRVLPDHGIAFAHRRLSILDLDPRADQPMESADGRFLITYNGEVYNFRELRGRLRELGARFRTESDTEVLLEGLRAWGIDGLLLRVVGMFAFALYDKEERRLVLARDRGGQKPLFYAETKGGLVFASEMRALLSLAPELRAIDPAGLDAYLQLKFTPSPATLYRGVRKLPPAHLLEAAEGRPAAPRRYWDPFSRGRVICGHPEKWIETIDRALGTAVERRLVSDVPVCLFLSGGIDSSLTAAYLEKSGARGMKSYTIGYGDLPDYNEFDYARMAAEKFGLNHEEVILNSGDAQKLLEDDKLVLDEPISDWVWVPLYQLAGRAHADGFKVVLVGEGSDEIFFGYDVMMQGLRQMERFEKPVWRALAKAGAAALAPIYRYCRKGHRRYDLMRRVASGEPVYLGSSIGFWRSQRHQVAGPRLVEEGDPDCGGRFAAELHRRFAETAPDPGDRANLICFFEFHAKMTEVLLQRVDRITMLHSLEARSPFLDHELIELAFSMPGRIKIKGGRLKGLLKELARRRLPAPIVDRRKMGFSFPFKEWLRGALGGLVERSFQESRLFADGWVQGSFARALLREHRAGLFDHAPRIWTLFSLARWYDRWIAEAP